MRESAIERKVCTYAKKRGCEVYKFVSPGKRGVPDRMFVTPSGKVFFIEFKAPGKKPSALQQREQLLLSTKGVSVWVVDTIQSGKEVIDEETT